MGSLKNFSKFGLIVASNGWHLNMYRYIWAKALFYRNLKMWQNNNDIILKDMLSTWPTLMMLWWGWNQSYRRLAPLFTNLSQSRIQEIILCSMRTEKPLLINLGESCYKSQDFSFWKFWNFDNSRIIECIHFYHFYIIDDQICFRKFYYLDEEQSIGDPDKTFITVPNIPLLSALSATKNEKGFGKTIKVDLILKEGRGTPFINVSFSGLLWG